MEAGKLRHRITILKPAATDDPTNQNEYGEVIEPWTVFVKTRASAEPLLGNEYFRAEAAQSKVEVKFRMRYRRGVENTMKVQFGGELYNILSAVDVEGRGRELLIYAGRE